MDSFDGSRRRDGRVPISPPERRPLRETEPLEQRFDRWMNTGRQLVEGVSGSRPGSRPAARGPEGRRSGASMGSRGGFDGLGRWVEDRLDWLLDDSDDWPEPWQQSARNRGDAGGSLERRSTATDAERPSNQQGAPSRWREDPTATAASPGRGPMASARREQRPRRPLEAISRRGAMAAPSRPANEREGMEAWPDDDTFSVPRWQRPEAPLRRPDPLQSELETRRNPVNPVERRSEAPAPGRPLPRSSRRR
ncbi:MAG: hypothetical protein ACKO0M_06410 [Cyanobium sp.]